MKTPVIAQKSPLVQKAEKGTYHWCACGKSKKQPFCDGSHKGTGLGPVKHVVAEKTTVWWCQCKHTAGAPLCDGSHKKLATP